MGLMSSDIIPFMYLCILSFCGKEMPSIQEFRVRRCLCTANSGKSFQARGATDQAFVEDVVQQALVHILDHLDQQFPLLPYTFATTPSCLHDNVLSTAAPQLA